MVSKRWSRLNFSTPGWRSSTKSRMPACRIRRSPAFRVVVSGGVDSSSSPRNIFSTLIQGAERCGQLIVATEYLQYLDPAVAVELGFGQGAADDRRTLRHQQFGHEGPAALGAQPLGEAVAIRKQAFAEQHDEGQADGRIDGAGQGNLEHAERGQPLLTRHAVHQDIG